MFSGSTRWIILSCSSRASICSRGLVTAAAKAPQTANKPAQRSSRRHSSSSSSKPSNNGGSITTRSQPFRRKVKVVPVMGVAVAARSTDVTILPSVAAGMQEGTTLPYVASTDHLDASGRGFNHHETCVLRAMAACVAGYMLQGRLGTAAD